jgi:quercetin dioxygenase-like cupin family protein
MDAATFTAQAKADGFTDIAERSLTVATGPEPHTHDFDARLFLTEGAFMLTVDGEKRTYAPGDWCEVPAGTVHAEEVGPHGASFIVAKRNP